MTGFPWRSLLYVPAHEERFIAKAAERGADAIILDLEDGVPEHAKDRASQSLPAAAARVSAGGAAVVVRIDGRWRRAWRDLEQAAAAGVAAVMVPKVRDPGTVAVISDYLAELEQELDRPAGSIGLIALIEDAAGLHAARVIAAVPRVWALIPGNLDLALALGTEPGGEAFVATHAQLLVDARAAGKAFIGTLGGGAEIRELEAFRASVVRARSFGSEAVTCVHPAQIPIVHEVFAPDPAALAAAARIVAAYDSAGGGAVAVDGAMVDRPVAERARALIASAKRDAVTGDERA